MKRIKAQDQQAEPKKPHWSIVLVIAPILVFLFTWVFPRISGEKYGEFLVSSNIDSARVFLNKDFKGLTDSRKAVKFESLKPGVYVLSVEKTGFNPFIDESVRITAGEISSIKVDLKINEAQNDSSRPIATENNKKTKIPAIGKTEHHRRSETAVAPETYEVYLEFPSSMTKAQVFVDGEPALKPQEWATRKRITVRKKDSTHKITLQNGSVVLCSREVFITNNNQEIIFTTEDCR